MGTPAAAARAPESMKSEFNVRIWLAWLSKVRIIVITFLLAIELTIVRLTATAVPERAFISLIALWYAISVFYLLLLKLWPEEPLQARLQVITDLFFANALIYLTGGIDTSFNFLNPLIIIVASILLSRAWAYVSALLSFILFGAILELSYFDLIHSYAASRPDPKSLQLVIFINLFAYLAVAYLASNLAAKLRQVNVELQDKSGALQNLQALHKHVIDCMSGGLITTGLDGRITLLNPAGEKLLDASAAGVFGKPVGPLFLDRLPAVGPGPVHNEVRCLTPKGKEKTFGVTASALNVPEGGLTGYIYALEDLTEVRRLEREVRMRDRLAAIGRMAGGIAHEVRNPLASIAGSIQVLAGMSELNQEQQALAEIVLRESDRLNAIITDFLLYARDKSYQMECVDLLLLLDDTLTILQKGNSTEPQIEILRRFETQAAFAVADADRMRQVFTNLYTHAVRAMPRGGRLVVTVAGSGDYWRISFANTGDGLTQQQIEKVFEPFQSEFDSGIGLGMALVYQILQAHDARISVRSAPGEGIDFVLELKRSEAPPRPHADLVQHAATRIDTPPNAPNSGVVWVPSRVNNG